MISYEVIKVCRACIELGWNFATMDKDKHIWLWYEKPIKPEDDLAYFEDHSMRPEQWEGMGESVCAEDMMLADKFHLLEEVVAWTDSDPLDLVDYAKKYFKEMPV